VGLGGGGGFFFGVGVFVGAGGGRGGGGGCFGGVSKQKKRKTLVVKETLHRDSQPLTRARNSRPAVTRYKKVPGK